MISSTTALFFATLAFNAATVFGAPLRFSDTNSEVTARAEVVAPVAPIARAAVFDLNDSRVRRFAAPRSRMVQERDFLEETVESRESAADEPVMRRYPRRALHDFYEKREPEPAPASVVEEPAVVRRYPRRALYDLHEKREPATTVKETVIMSTKFTTHDTPEDAAAFASVIAAGSPQPTGTSVSTLISISQTTTISAPGSSATPSGTSSAASSAITSAPTSTESASSASGSPKATSTGAAAEPSASASATSSSGDSKPTGTSADPATPAASEPAAGGEPKANPPAEGGDKKNEPAVPPPAGGNEGRRDFIPLASTISGRQLGVSGASLASALRRGLPQSLH